MARVLIERLSEGAVPPAGSEPRKVDAPNVSAIRLVFGVGSGPKDAPTDKTFKPVYTVSIPVFSLGGLDPDGIYEYDAATQLETLQTRSQRRKWAVRLELEVTQAAESVAAADLYVTTPEGGVSMDILGRTRTGTITSGGGRSVVLATELVQDRAGVEKLAGSYVLQLSDSEPGGDGAPSLYSAERPVNVAFTRFEFEG